MKSALLLAFVLVSFVAVSQKLPLEYHFSKDGRRLARGGSLNTGLYDLSTFKTVELDFEQENYWQLLTNNYDSETPIAASLKYDGNFIGDIGVRFRGHSSYFTIKKSQKKSFKLDIDFISDSLRLRGYKNLRLNNAHQDPSFMREVLYSQLASEYMPMAKVNYVNLFINGQDWGVYVNSQHQDKTFLKEWYLTNDGAFFRANNDNLTRSSAWYQNAGLKYLGETAIFYREFYSLKSSDIEQPWQKLARICEILTEENNNDLAFIEKYIDVDQALWFLASENIFMDDDSYVHKGAMDYLIYIEAETGQANLVEYDGNTIMQFGEGNRVLWNPFKNSNNSDYPLLYKLLNIPKFKQRYLAHYRTILDETMTLETVKPFIDSLDNLIRKEVLKDTKKIYSYNDYLKSLENLKEFVVERKAFLNSDAQVKQMAPRITRTEYFNHNREMDAPPFIDEPVIINAWISEDVPVKKVNLYYSDKMVGNFKIISMFDDGMHNDEDVGDGIYGVELPGFREEGLVRYYIEAMADTESQSVSYSPAKAENEVYVFTVRDKSF